LQCANVSNDVEVETKGAKALAINIKSLAHLKAKLHRNRHERGITRISIGRGKVANKVQFKDKTAISAHIF
jgi:hypothetical protein